jgi:hypothetical protein
MTSDAIIRLAPNMIGPKSKTRSSLRKEEYMSCTQRDSPADLIVEITRSILSFNKIETKEISKVNDEGLLCASQWKAARKSGLLRRLPQLERCTAHRCMEGRHTACLTGVLRASSTIPQ